MKKVLLVGPLLTSSGYGVHSRQVFQALAQRNDVDLYVQPTSWGNTSWILDQKFNNNIIKKIVEYSLKVNETKLFDESFQIALPNEWRLLANKNVGITAGFECDIVKKSWIEYCNQMDHVITPSEFSRLAFLNTSSQSGITLKTDISVINEWYYDQFNKENKVNNNFFDFKYNKNILIFGQVTSKNKISDRKNILKTIQTAIDFVKDKDIGVVLKINMSKSTTFYKKMVTDFVKENIQETLWNKITLLLGNFTIEELKMLYRSDKISCFLSGTRAEGWGLPFIEAASCGLPIIATNYSSYKEFLEDDFLKVEYDLVVFDSDIRFVDLDASPKWAEFRANDMLKNLGLFFKNEKLYIDIAKRRKKIIKQNYNSLHIIDNYKKFFESNCK